MRRVNKKIELVNMHAAIIVSASPEAEAESTKRNKKKYFFFYLSGTSNLELIPYIYFYFSEVRASHLVYYVILLCLSFSLILFEFRCILNINDNYLDIIVLSSFFLSFFPIF
ncbi:hypothetical protein ACJX0J_027570 [Zea mays]